MFTKSIRSIAAPATIASLTACAIALVGCGGNSYKVSDAGRHDKITHDLTPELFTQYQRLVDVEDETRKSVNGDMRQLQADLHQIMLFDRPTRLTRLPSPY